MQKTRIFWLATLTTMTLSSKTLAGIIFVNLNATGANDGTTWTNAFVDLSDAIAAASSGDEIWVAQGTYMPSNAPTRTTLTGQSLCATYTTACPGILSRAKSFVLPANVNLYGGFVGSESQLTDRTLDSSVTILSGDLNGNDDPSDATTYLDNALQVVVIQGSSTSQQVVERLTIRAGYSLYIDPFFGVQISDFEAGAGMIILDGAVTIDDVRFLDNIAPVGGGALAIVSSKDVEINNSLFENNRLLEDWVGIGQFFTRGGGAISHHFFPLLHTEQGNLTVDNCDFLENSSTKRAEGGAIHFSSTSPTQRELVVIDSRFVSNSGGYQIPAGMQFTEGASTLEADVATVIDSTFAENTGGCAVLVSGEADISGSIFRDNVTIFQLLGSQANSAGAISANILNLSDSTFERNIGESYGAVWANSLSNVENCIFRENQAAGFQMTGSLYGRGGGLSVGFASLVNRCTFDSNTATASGGGLYITGYFTNVANCLLADNSADLGGGLYIDNESGTSLISNITVAGNTATIGGGIYREANGFLDPTIVVANSILWSNQDSVGGLSDQIAGTSFPNLSVIYTVVDDPSSSYGGTGMIYQDPRFVDAANGNFRLRLSTPARDTGLNSALDFDADSIIDFLFDLDGSRRLQGATKFVDMGSFEKCFADLNGDGLVNFFDNSTFLGLYNASSPEADLDRNGILNFFDYSIWIGIYNNGTACN